jgi:Schlafen, AlbA_2
MSGSQLSPPPLKHAARIHLSNTGSRQTRALRKLVLVFAGLSVIVLGATAYSYITHRQELSADHIRQITQAAGVKCNEFFQPIWSTASVIRQWGESGVLREKNTETLNAKLLPLLEQIPHIQAMHMVSPQGRLIYGLMRRDGQWAACRTPESDPKNQKVTWQFYDRSGAKMNRQFESEPPDQLTRQHWVEARNQSATYPLNWTPPYPLFPTGKVGISAISGWKNGAPSLSFGLDFRMTDIKQLLNEIKVTESTVFFLFAQGRLLVDFQETADDPTTAMIIKALDDWTKSDPSDGPFRFQHDGVPWWGLLVDADESPGRLGGIGIFSPEVELVQLKPHGNLIFIPVALVIFWAFLLAYSRGVFNQDAAESGLLDPERISPAELQAIIEGGEHDRLEFKSTLRWNLKAEKAGKEIELAIMKSLAAFMNSAGGSLVVGVDDQGGILGLETDQFPNADKYLQHFSNLFNQHIGMEFSPFIRFGIRPLGEKHVFIIACRPSPRAVFVKDKQEERFFIRSGASTRQLKMSQVLEYVEERRKALS